jgi:hypothetical protein
MKTRDTIWYEDVIRLGFTEEKLNDSVFQKMHGFDDSAIYKYLNESLMISFDKTTMKCEVLKLDKDENIKARKRIKKLWQLEMIISAFE